MSTTTVETVLTNALLVLPGEVVPGTVVLRGGLLAEVQPGRSGLSAAEDLEGDHLIPGAVDLHTDNLERQVQPRANARWPSRSAMLAHDAQCAAAGVTTVLDALCLGDLGFDMGRDQTFWDGVRDLDALAGTGLLRSEHFLHLRCELPALDMPKALEAVADHPLVRMVSVMDHSPGFGQYRDLDRYRRMRVRQKQMTDAEVARRIAELLEQRERVREPQRRWLLERIAHRDLPLASHDDDDPAEMDRNRRDGITISEFPVLMEAAEHAARHRHGGDRRRAERGPRRQPFGQRRRGRPGAGRRGRRAGERLRAGRHDRGGLALRGGDGALAAGGGGDGHGRAGAHGAARRPRAHRAGPARGPGAGARP